MPPLAPQHLVYVDEDPPAAAASSTPATDHAGAEGRRLMRKISNRDSARRSRARKQRHLDDLRALAARLRGVRGELASRADAAVGSVAVVRLANAEMRDEATALSHRLETAWQHALLLDQLYAMTAGVGTTFEQTVSSSLIV